MVAHCSNAGEGTPTPMTDPINFIEFVEISDKDFLSFFFGGYIEIILEEMGIWLFFIFFYFSYFVIKRELKGFIYLIFPKILCILF